MMRHRHQHRRRRVLQSGSVIMCSIVACRRRNHPLSGSECVSVWSIVFCSQTIPSPPSQCRVALTPCSSRSCRLQASCWSSRFAVLSGACCHSLSACSWSSCSDSRIARPTPLAPAPAPAAVPPPRETETSPSTSSSADDHPLHMPWRSWHRSCVGARLARAGAGDNSVMSLSATSFCNLTLQFRHALEQLGQPVNSLFERFLFPGNR